MKNIINQLQNTGAYSSEEWEGTDIPYFIMNLKAYCSKNNIFFREFIITRTVPSGDYYMGVVSPVTFTFPEQGFNLAGKTYMVQPREGKGIEAFAMEELEDLY